jgi:hypothetical protein
MDPETPAQAPPPGPASRPPQSKDSALTEPAKRRKLVARILYVASAALASFLIADAALRRLDPRENGLDSTPDTEGVGDVSMAERPAIPPPPGAKDLAILPAPGAGLQPYASTEDWDAIAAFYRHHFTAQGWTRRPDLAEQAAAAMKMPRALAFANPRMVCTILAEPSRTGTGTAVVVWTRRGQGLQPPGRTRDQEKGSSP